MRPRSGGRGRRDPCRRRGPPTPPERGRGRRRGLRGLRADGSWRILLEICPLRRWGDGGMPPGREGAGIVFAMTAEPSGPDDHDDALPIPVADSLDLHTIRPREVREVVLAYVEEAARLGFAEVRLIHGRGQGVQR